MKRFFNTLGIGLFIVMVTWVSKPAAAQSRFGVNINFQTFYDQLSPYGDWIDYPEYGYVWRPRMGGDFRPYSTGGHWVYTNDYDWMWASDYDWGWGPFHYGRWFYDSYYGWVWVPGYEWSPAWVSWRGGGDYYGWAPLRPGISISVGFGNYNPPYMYWTFAPCRYMNSSYISRYYYPYRNNMTIFNHTTIINNYGGRGGYYTNGPRRSEVERYTGRINEYRVRESSRPGRVNINNNEVSIYRPAVQRSRDNYSPRNVEAYNRDVSSRRSRPMESVNNNNVSSQRNTIDAGTRDANRIDRTRTNADWGNNRNINMQSNNERLRRETDNSNQRINEMRQQRAAEVQRNQQMQRNQEAQQRSERVERVMQQRQEVQRSNEVMQQRQVQRQAEVVQQRQQSVQRSEPVQQRVSSESRSSNSERGGSTRRRF